MATTLLHGGTVVTCDEQARVLRADVLLDQGQIIALGRGARAAARRRQATVIDARDRLILPGLIFTHVHLCQALMRGLADDLPLLEWLQKRVWPMEAAHDKRTLRSSAELGVSELLLSGVTTILDLGTVHDHDVVFDACVRSGIRVFGGKTLMDAGSTVPKRLRETTTASLADGERLQRTWSNHESGRVSYVWIPRFILSCTEALVRGAAERAMDTGVLMHTHAAEHAAERQAVRDALGADDVDLLRRWGFSGPSASIAHGVQLTRRQMKQLARDGTGVVHCPSANLKLGSGVAKVSELLSQGVIVGLGADGAPCNNNLDAFVELRHAALLAAGTSGPGVVPAQRALDLLTRGGAKLLGAEAQLGSVEVGKAADIVVLRQDGLHVAPAADPVSTIVYGSQSQDVEHVFVSGQHVVADGQLRTLDASEVATVARREARRLLRRAGL